MLWERSGGNIRLAAGVQGQSNIPGVMALPLRAITPCLLRGDGVRSEQHGTVEMLNFRIILR
jgi:hypothetical protein